jgi:hypothetical protein
MVASETIMIGLFGYGEYTASKEKKRTIRTGARDLAKKNGKDDADNMRRHPEK